MAKLNFTARGIDAIKPPCDGLMQIDYWDTNTTGLGLRVSRSGRKSWVVLYRFSGRLRRLTLGTYPSLQLAEARALAKDALHKAANGIDAITEKKAERSADTFSELADEYLECHAKRKKKSWKEDQRIIDKFLRPRWSNWKAKDITRKDILRFLDAEVDRGAPVQANKSFALVRKIFNFGISRDIVEMNPCQAVDLPTKPRTRDRVLSPEEIRAFWASLEFEDSRVRAMFGIRLLTAQRGGEVLTMEWSEVDLETGWWVIPARKAKNGLAHRVPLSEAALEQLRSLADMRVGSSFVFPSRYDSSRPMENIQKAIQRIRARAGVIKALMESGITISAESIALAEQDQHAPLDIVGHDLRRTAASHMASIGVHRLVISKILNHVESGVTAIYDRHSYDKEKRDALERWASRLEEILGLEVKSELMCHVRSSEVAMRTYGH